MANKYLAREDAPFGDDVWRKLDTAMIDAAKSQLVGRRLLALDGPYGLGLKFVPLQDEESEGGFIGSEMLPLQLIQQEFTLGARDLANYEREGTVLDTGAVSTAAMKVAELEDELIFQGVSGGAAHTDGLLTVDGALTADLSDWSDVGAAAEDVITAVTTLDSAGFHGPYTMALAPSRYNRLFRRYDRGNQTELEHLKNIVTAGIVKAPVLDDGGVILEAGRQSAYIVLGQDMTVGFIGPAGKSVEFTVSESLALRIRHPQAICVLGG